MSVFTDRDGAFSYAGFWFAGNFTTAGGTFGTLHTTNDLTSSATFTFPVAAIGFEFWGMKRSHGGSYTICIDCTSSSVSGGAVSVDGFDPTDNGLQPPVQLFSHTFSTSGVHQILLSNVADSRGTPQGNSQLAIASFVLTPPPKTTAQQAPPPPTTTAKNNPSSSTSTTTTSSSTTIASSSGFTTTGTSSTTTGTTSSNPSSTETSASSGISSTFSETSASSGVSSISPASTRTGSQSLLPTSSTALPTHRENETATTAGAAGGGAVLLLILLTLLIFYCRRRRRRGISGIDTEVARPYFVGPGAGTETAGTGTGVFTNGARSNQSGQTRTEGDKTLPSWTTGSNYKGTVASGSVTVEGSATAGSSSSAVQTPDQEMGEKGAMWLELPRAGPVGANEPVVNEIQTRYGSDTDALPRAQDAGSVIFATELPPEYGAVFPTRV